MTTAPVQPNPVKPMADSMLEENQPIKPNLFKKSAIITKAPNQTMVSQADFSFSTSSQVNTPAINSTDNPKKAVAVASMENCSPKISAGILAQSND